MILHVDANDPVPVYEQIRSQIERMVASGALRAGVQLPTIRQLAADLGLSKGSVERAFQLLESEALIETRGRAGSFVRSPRPAAAAQAEAALEQASDSFAVAVYQLHIDDDAAVQAVRDALTRLRTRSLG
ncbi:MAG: GntR family transcriptional regulator [Acidimicrobiales bacterium]